MDPIRPDTAVWNQVDALTGSLTAFVGFVVLGAFALVLGHAIIPSLAASNRLPRGVERQRPVFYAVSVAAFALAIFQAQQWIRVLYDVLSQVFSRWLI
mgnify:CR=1 FL=1